MKIFSITVCLLAVLMFGSPACDRDGTDNETTTTTTILLETTSTTTTTADPDDLLVNDFEPVSGPGSAPERAGGLGPWATRLMLAESDDGLTFTRTGEIVADQAGVPDAIVDHQGRTRIYYQAWQNYDPKTGVDGDFMAFAIHDEETGTWYYHKVILDRQYAASPVDPSVAVLTHGRYRLYYMADTGNFDLNIFSATSDLGLRFTVDNGTRLSPDEPVFDPMVLQISNSWLMIAGPDGMYSAVSYNGLIFNESGPFIVDGRSFHAWSGVELPAGGYRLYGYFIGDGGLTSVSSTDGATWHEDSGYRLTDNGANPEFEAGIVSDCGVTVLQDGSFLMAYLAIIPEAM